MEVLGTVAALVALTKDVATVSDSLVRHFRHAPKELVRLRNQISLVYLELTYLDQFDKRGMLDTLLPTEEVQLLLHAMQIARNDITAIHDELRTTSKMAAGKPPASTRLSWALFDRKSVDGALEQLERVESRLLCFLQLINLRMNIDLRKDNVGLGTQIIEELKTQRVNAVVRRPKPDDLSALAKDTHVESTVVFRHNYSFELGEIWSKIFGSELEVTTSNNEYQRAYEIYARLPLPSFTGRMAFLVTLSMRRAWGFWPNVSVLSGGINFVNVIPVDSEIIAACRRGDIMTVQRLFSEKKAAPNDMTTARGTLIYHAIESGSTRLVQFLLDTGAPVNPRQLLRAAWRRQPDMARVLLRTKRVDVESLHVDGDTTASLLYGNARPRQQQTEFIAILASHSFSQFNTQDAYGWTVLHRAAAWGTAVDVEILLRMGTMLGLRTRNLSWTPLMCSVANDNPETLKELCGSETGHLMAEERDLRGWSLLHIAVAYGGFKTIPYLLEIGVDLQAASDATMCHVPQLVKGKSVTPGQLARTFGEAAYRKWSESLEAAGRTVDVRPEEIDWAQEETLDLFGKCECCDNWKS